ncbi:insulin-like growth factor-binding protein complex acid labile subunit isoform X1 [Bombus pyrosoma]|uniref:insulin-like growth factor-binding protein complex acid labile subunit isoform X1 n=2 Tax=Bombus pyrosoma TaxID=396416 RepID=UPI001CB8BBC7|nr:insulin-like growth factor-binding protein complex acid labile subunit isoform X1 [Bombus pyrosoma]
MMVILILVLTLLNECFGQIIDIGDVWEVKCPPGCSCEVQKFIDLPLHRWIKTSQDQNLTNECNFEFGLNMDHSMIPEFLNVAICAVAEDYEELLDKLPSDIQVFTILESGMGNFEILLQSTTFQRFTDLISLDIQGIDYESVKRSSNVKQGKQGGIVLSVDSLYPLGLNLLYLNLERVRLTSLSPMKRNKANLVVKPMNTVTNDENNNKQLLNNISQSTGHRLIFLSQQNSGESDDKEILPYDVYKQEMEGYQETVGLFTGLGALTHLRVYDCDLKDITWHMFDGLNNLVHLSLEKNSLKFIPEFCFYGTPNLKVLSLASNQLLTLKSVDLAGLLMLEDLDLRGNNLTFLSELSFPPFPMLKIADFRKNPLDSIFPSTFEIMNTTLELYLGGEDSKLYLQKNSFLGLCRLQALYLYNLEIPMLERFVFQGMPELLKLRARGNISSIDLDAFVDLIKLVDLDLSSCHIRKISMDAFYGLQNVKRIDLSNNELEYIPPGLFGVQQQKQLKEIILSKNKLTSLPIDFFKMLRIPNKPPQFSIVRLDSNPWDCTCSMITWNPYLVNRLREIAPRCSTPKKLKNWGVFHALRKGGLQCRTLRRRYLKKSTLGRNNYEDNIIS